MENFKKALEYYSEVSSLDWRVNQLKDMIDCIGYFPFPRVNCIETGASKDFVTDGAVGTFFAKLCELTQGEFHSVDIEPSTVKKSKELYKSLNLEVFHYTQDSVKFLKETSVSPNLVHLDSWDVDLENPLPCALHGWREFEAIEDKMPVGSILIIDDNWFKGTWVEWVYSDRPNKKIDIDYPILGKGALVWHFIEEGESNWKKLSEDKVGSSQKIIYQKVKFS